MHYIADDLDSWVEDHADEGIAELETLLAKHALFAQFLASNDLEGG